MAKGLQLQKDVKIKAVIATGAIREGENYAYLRLLRRVIIDGFLR